jgi:hypothetical protein
MVTILFWPNGDWAYENEVWKPEPGFQTARVSDYWPDERVNDFVSRLLADERSDPADPAPTTLL